MAEISSTALLARIKGLLKGADLETMTTKKVRKQLEEEFGTSLEDRRQEISKMVENIINASSESEASNANGKSSDSDEGVDDDGPAAVSKKTKKAMKRKRSSSSDNDDEKMARKLQAEEEEKGKRSTRNKGSSSKAKSKKTKEKKSKKGSEENGDETKPKKANGYMKSLPLSIELSSFLGEPEMPRHAVVKRIWAYCKERNLYDPKNKQFAICDTELLKVIGVKRFRLFGMMKLLSKHFIPEH